MPLNGEREWQRNGGRWMNSVRDICLPASIITAAACFERTVLHLLLHLLLSPHWSTRPASRQEFNNPNHRLSSVNQRSFRQSQVKFSLQSQSINPGSEGKDRRGGGCRLRPRGDSGYLNQHPDWHVQLCMGISVSCGLSPDTFLRAQTGMEDQTSSFFSGDMSGHDNWSESSESSVARHVI